MAQPLRKSRGSINHISHVSQFLRENTHQVVTQKLHDQGGILVALLGKGIELGNGIVESGLGKVASLVWGVQDLVVEDREVQGETQTDGVGRRKVGLGNFGGVLVSLK